MVAQPPGAGPIDPRYVEQMQAIAQGLDEILNGKGQPKKVAFVVLIAETDKIEGGRVNYISNADRSDVVSMMKETLARFEGRALPSAPQPSGGGH